MDKKYTLVVYMANDDEAKSYRKVQGAQTISAPNPDAAKEEVRKILKAKNYTIRSMSFTPCKKIIAYTGPKGQAPVMGGWRYKKPPRSTTKL